MTYLSIVLEQLLRFFRGYFFWHTQYVWRKAMNLMNYMAHVKQSHDEKMLYIPSNQGFHQRDFVLILK